MSNPSASAHLQTRLRLSTTSLRILKSVQLAIHQSIPDKRLLQILLQAPSTFQSTRVKFAGSHKLRRLERRPVV
jgi:hypothetical protein